MRAQPHSLSLSHLLPSSFIFLLSFSPLSSLSFSLFSSRCSILCFSSCFSLSFSLGFTVCFQIHIYILILYLFFPISFLSLYSLFFSIEMNDSMNECTKQEEKTGLFFFLSLPIFLFLFSILFKSDLCIPLSSVFFLPPFPLSSHIPFRRFSSLPLLHLLSRPFFPFSSLSRCLPLIFSSTSIILLSSNLLSLP